MRSYKILFLLPVLFLAACAQPLSMYEMMPKPATFEALGENKALANKVAVGEVLTEKGLGGSAPVVSEQYKASLVASLSHAGWYTDAEKAKYVLEANVLEVDQPFMAFNTTVTTKTHYSLKEKASDKVVFEETLSLPCTTRFGEAINADIRLRMATACAVGENTTHLMNVLNRKY